MPLFEKFIDGERHLALNGLLGHRVVGSSDIGLWIAPTSISRETLSHSDITELSHGRCRRSRLVLISPAFTVAGRAHLAPIISAMGCRLKVRGFTSEPCPQCQV